MSGDRGVAVDEPADKLEESSEIQIDEAYERAKKRALAMLHQGFDMGGGPYPPREELHERYPADPVKVDSDEPSPDSE